MTEIGKGYVGILFDKARIGRELGEALAAGEGEAKAAGALLGHGVGLGIAAGVGVAVAAGVGLFAVGEEFEKQYNRIRVATGKTGEELHGLEDTFKQVASDVPASFSSVGTAISDLSVRLGLTGEPLRAMSDQLLELSRITGTDIATNVTNVSQLFNNFGIGAAEQAGKLDELFRASQATGIGISDLASSMATGGAVFRQLGFTFEDTAALLALLNKAGVDAGAVMMPLSKAIATAAKNGVDAGTMFRQLFDGIRNGTATTADAIAVFGARAGPRLFGLIHEGKLSYEELSASIAAGGDSIMKAGEDTMTLGDKIHLLWNRIKVDVEPVAMWVVDHVNLAFDTLGEGITRGWKIASSILDQFVAGFTGSGHTVQTTWGQVGATVADAWTRVRDVFHAALAEISQLVDFYGPRLRDIWAEVVAVWDRDVYPVLHDKVLPVLQQIGGWIRDHMTPILIGLGVGIGLLVSPIATIAAGLIYSYAHFKTFRDVVDSVVTWLHDRVPPAFFAVRDAALPVLNVVGAAVADFARFFTERWDKIRGSLETVLNIFKYAVALSLVPAYIAWTYFHDQILAVVQVVWNQIGTVVSSVVRVIGDVFDFVTSVLTGQWGDAWAAIADIPAAAVAYLRDTMGSFLSFVVEFFQSVPSNIINAMNYVGDSVLSLGESLVGSVVSGLENKLNDVLDWFTSLPGAIFDALPGATSALLQIGIDFLNGLWDGAKDVVRNMLAWFTELPGRIKDAIGNLGSLLLDVGKGLVTGFLEGITSAFSKSESPLDKLAGIVNHINDGTGSGPTIPKQGAYDVGGWIDAAYNMPVSMIGHGGEYVLSTDMLRGRQPIDDGVLAAMLSGRSGGSSRPVSDGVHIAQVIVQGENAPDALTQLPGVLRQAVTIARR